MRRGVRLRGIKVVTKPNGKRFVYRRVGSSLVRLPDLPENDPRFIKAYLEAGNAESKSKCRYADGSIGALCTHYLSSSDYKRLANSTQQVRRRILDKIVEIGGSAMVKHLRTEHLRKDIRKLSHGAASNRLKAWRAILNFAVDDGWINENPSTHVKLQRSETKPHKQWTADEIAQFRNYWEIQTRQRTAFEVVYWTGARCVDAVRLGNQMVTDGWLTYIQEKTSGPASCPIDRLPVWCSELQNDFEFFKQSQSNSLLWIVTKYGKPRSVKGLSQWMSKSAKQAGLPDDCTAHGLRKARAASLAEIGATASQIGAWTGHTSLSEIAHYTRKADQVRILGGTRQVQKLETEVVEFPKTQNK